MTTQEIIDAIQGETGYLCAEWRDGEVSVARGNYCVCIFTHEDPPQVVFDHAKSKGHHHCPWSDTSPAEIRDFLNSGARPTRAVYDPEGGES